MSDSPAYHLIRHVYDEQGHRMGYSRDRFRQGIRSAVKLAIRYGLRFDVDDFNKIQSFYQAGEQEYALACGIERGHYNLSAAKAYEKYQERKPFLIRSVGYPRSPGVSARRVAVGMEFGWYEETKEGIKPIIATCTSFSEGGRYLNACTYQGWTSRDRELRINDPIDVGRGNYQKIDSIEDQGLTLRLKPHIYRYSEVYSRKIDRRFKITHAAIKEYHKMLDDAAKVEADQKKHYENIAEAERAISESDLSPVAAAVLRSLISSADSTRAETADVDAEE